MDINLEPITPEEAVEWYVRDKEAEYAESTLKAHKSRLGHFLRWCAQNDIANMNDLTGRALHRYRIWRRDDGDLNRVSEKTQMGSIRVFIEWAESIDAVEPDLSTKVTSPSLSKGDDVSNAMVDAEQAEKILDYLNQFEYASERHVAFRLMWRAALRRGSIVALDVPDYDRDEQSLEILHRPDLGSPLKNKKHGERLIGLTSETCDIMDAWIENHRPNVTDEFGRNPLISSPYGRAHPTTVQNWVYSLTRPCFVENKCPHGEEISKCEAAIDRTKAFQCPSSLSPHPVRRGALTHWLSEDLPESFAVSRANVSPEILSAHYDRRSQRKKMSQRRKYLDDF